MPEKRWQPLISCLFFCVALLEAKAYTNLNDYARSFSSVLVIVQGYEKINEEGGGAVQNLFNSFTILSGRSFMVIGLSWALIVTTNMNRS